MACLLESPAEYTHPKSLSEVTLAKLNLGHYDHNLEVVQDLGGLFHGFATVSRDQFQYFAGLAVSRHPSIQALGGVLIVLASPPRGEAARRAGLREARRSAARPSRALEF